MQASSGRWSRSLLALAVLALGFGPAARAQTRVVYVEEPVRVKAGMSLLGSMIGFPLALPGCGGCDAYQYQGDSWWAGSAQVEVGAKIGDAAAVVITGQVWNGSNPTFYLGNHVGGPITAVAFGPSIYVVDWLSIGGGAAFLARGQAGPGPKDGIGWTASVRATPRLYGPVHLVVQAGAIDVGKPTSLLGLGLGVFR